jgi:hypothetical protein
VAHNISSTAKRSLLTPTRSRRSSSRSKKMIILCFFCSNKHTMIITNQIGLTNDNQSNIGGFVNESPDIEEYVMWRIVF